MRRLGQSLMALGVIVGAAAAVWVAIGLDRVALPWLVSLGLVKLTIVASFGLMAGGAMLVRVARRRSDAASVEQIPAGSQTKALGPPEGKEPIGDWSRPSPSRRPREK
jgi:hypothetical protein